MGQLTILQSHWSLPYFGNRPKKFELVHRIISCQDVSENFWSHRDARVPDLQFTRNEVLGS